MQIVLRLRRGDHLSDLVWQLDRDGLIGNVVIDGRSDVRVVVGAVEHHVALGKQLECGIVHGVGKAEVSQV